MIARLWILLMSVSRVQWIIVDASCSMKIPELTLDGWKD